jgi:catechol 2,3-dioxygenase-like lactoylglutathione lyase family enzyme
VKEESIMPRAKIQQIRTAAYDPQRLADFYCSVFDMQVVLKDPEESIHLTDGHVDLTILKGGVKGERYRPEGLQGYGFLVEDLEETEALAPQYGALVGVTRRKGAESEYAEAELLDPIGNSVELSERGFGVEVPRDITRLSRASDPWAPQVETRPRIQHIANGPYDQERMVDFYCNVFGMSVVYRRGPHAEDNNRPGGIFLTDGRINFALNVPTTRSGRINRQGFSHFGFFVENSEETYERAMKAGAIGAYPTPSGVYAEGHILDPIGVRVDVAQEGFAIQPPEDVGALQGHDEMAGQVVTSFESVPEEAREKIVSRFRHS